MALKFTYITPSLVIFKNCLRKYLVDNIVHDNYQNLYDLGKNYVLYKFIQPLF